MVLWIQYHHHHHHHHKSNQLDCFVHLCSFHIVTLFRYTYRKLCYIFRPQIVSAILTKQSPGNHINVYSTNETKYCPISERKKKKKRVDSCGINSGIFIPMYHVWDWISWTELIHWRYGSLSHQVPFEIQSEKEKQIWKIKKSCGKNVHPSVLAALIFNIHS